MGLQARVICRELQQPLPGGVPRQGADIHAQRVASGLLGLARLLQQAAPAQSPWLAKPKRVRHETTRSFFPLRSPNGSLYRKQINNIINHENPFETLSSAQGETMVSAHS